MNPARSGILLLEDDVLARRAMVRLLKSVADVSPTATVAEARDLFGTRRWGGIVVDVTLPDGSGLDWLADVRRTEARVPALVVTAHCTQTFVNRAFSLQASYLCKPFSPNDLLSFAQTVAAHDVAEGKTLAEMISQLAERHELTPREVEIVSAATRGIGSKEFVATRGISMNTYKSQVRCALRKIGAGSLGEVRDNMLRKLDS